MLNGDDDGKRQQQITFNACQSTPVARARVPVRSLFFIQLHPVVFTLPAPARLVVYYGWPKVERIGLYAKRL